MFAKRECVVIENFPLLRTEMALALCGTRKAVELCVPPSIVTALLEQATIRIIGETDEQNNDSLRSSPGEFDLRDFIIQVS